jgi:hypothetical protein
MQIDRLIEELRAVRDRNPNAEVVIITEPELDKAENVEVDRVVYDVHSRKVVLS